MKTIGMAAAVVLALSACGAAAQQEESFIDHQGHDMREYVCLADPAKDDDRGYIGMLPFTDTQVAVSCTHEFVRTFCDWPQDYQYLHDRWCNPRRMRLYEILIARDAGQPVAGDSAEPDQIAPGAASETVPGRDVTAIQRMLNQHGYDADLPDGAVGERTRRAIANFQRDSGLSIDRAASRAVEMALRALGTPSADGGTGGHSPAGVEGGEINVSAPTGNCATDMRQLELDMARISAQAQRGEVGMCQAHQANFEVLSAAADLLRRCPDLDDPGNPQATEFERSASVSRQAMDGPCS